MLFNSNRIIQVSNDWSDYVDKTILLHLKTIRSIIDLASINGTSTLSKEQILQLHSAESAVAYFLHPHWHKLFDYQLAKKMISEKIIQLYFFPNLGEKQARRRKPRIEIVEVPYDENYDSSTTSTTTATDDDSSTTTGDDDEYDGYEKNAKANDMNQKVLAVVENTGMRLHKRGHYYHEIPYFLAKVFLCLPQNQCSQHDEQKKLFILKLVAMFARNYYTDNKEFTNVRNVSSAFKESTVVATIKKRKQRGHGNNIFIDGIVNSTDIINGLKNPKAYKEQLLASIIFTGSKDNEVENILLKEIECEYQVFPRRMISDNGSMYTWSRIYKKGDELPPPSSHDSSTIVAMRNLKQYTTEDGGKVFFFLVSLYY